MTNASRTRLVVTEQTKPCLPRHVRLRFEPVREKYVVMSPEKVFWPDEIGVAILKLCDGSRDIGAIADTLAPEYNAARNVILEDILEFLQEWSDNLLLKN